MYIMSYFTDEELCARLAKSEDLMNWEDLNGGKPVVCKTPDTLIRDPFIIKDKSGVFHMIFTVNWNGNQLGHCESTDLISWTETDFVAVMPENTQNVWAPECIYDEDGDEYIVYWSSSVPKGEYNHRIWYCKTKDFKEFSKSEILFDPGYSCIDADIIRVQGKYIMIYKDERGDHSENTCGKDLYLAFADKASGPYENTARSFSPKLVEGPCAVKKDGGFYIFFESFTKHYYNCFFTENFEKFEDISSKVGFPKDCKHFSIIEV